MPPSPSRERSRNERTPWWTLLLAGFAYSAIMALTFPPIGLWPMAVAAPVPLLWAAGACRPRWAPGGGGTGISRGKGGGAWPPWLAGLLVAVGSLPLWVYQERWLIEVTLPGYPGLVLYMAMWTGLSVAITAWLLKWGPRTKWWTIGLCEAGAIGIVGCELLRGEVVLTGYAWFLSAQPLIELPILAMPAALFGVYFVSLLVCALAGALGDAMGWSPRSRPMGSVAGMVVMIVWIVTAFFGRASIDRIYEPRGGGGGRGEEVTVAVVQTNLPQSNKKKWDVARSVEDWARWTELTRRAVRTRPIPDMIVWPETMYPGTYLDNKSIATLQENGMLFGEFAEALITLQKQVERPLIMGAIAAENLEVVRDGDYVMFKTDRKFNSVFLVAEGKVSDQRYDKVELTPFGEVIPYVWRWPALQERVLAMGAAGMAFDLSPGQSIEPIRVSVARSADDARLAAGGGSVKSGAAGDAEPRTIAVAAPICFEATKSPHVARLVAGVNGRHRQAQLILNLSNDGWFTWATGRREQHLLAARWRCVETGTPMVRAVNTGVSASIDADGSIRAAGIEPEEPPPVEGEDQDRKNAVSKPIQLTDVEGLLLTQTRVPSIDAPMTPFTRWTNAVAWMVISAAAGVVGVGVLSRMKRRPAG